MISFQALLRMTGFRILSAYTLGTRVKFLITRFVNLRYSAECFISLHHISKRQCIHLRACIDRLFRNDVLIRRIAVRVRNLSISGIASPPIFFVLDMIERD
jgi:hypothetical protein